MDKIDPRKYLQDHVVDDLMASAEAVHEFEQEFQALTETREFLRTNYLEARLLGLPVGVKFVLPSNLNRLIWNAKRMFHIDDRDPSNLSPVDAIKRVRELGEKLMVVVGDDNLSKVIPHFSFALRLTS